MSELTPVRTMHKVPMFLFLRHFQDALGTAYSHRSADSQMGSRFLSGLIVQKFWPNKVRFLVWH